MYITLSDCGRGWEKSSRAAIAYVDFMFRHLWSITERLFVMQCMRCFSCFGWFESVDISLPNYLFLSLSSVSFVFLFFKILFNFVLPSRGALSCIFHIVQKLILNIETLLLR
ncbi:hypothetical protein CFP56_019032 [Quercus suber]|uniref:Uncharacterized protein n=1 Tax=Quercus suber TaxID=58331 RepID=A0AAW0KJR4_QUESU